MLPVFVPLILILASSAVPMDSSSGASCEDTRSFELSLPSASLQEICVSPGTMTGMLFDTNVVVDIQDEERFVEVARGHNGISLVPPADMTPGERLRLTVNFQVGGVHQSVTFALVAHPGQATHQVNVYRDTRTWQSLRDEANLAVLKSGQQQKENENLREELGLTKATLKLSVGLSGLYANGYLIGQGITARVVDASEGARAPHSLDADRAITYRSAKSLGVEVWVSNNTTEPWRMVRASFVTAEGRTVVADRIWQKLPLLPGQSLQVFVEFETASENMERVTVQLWEDGQRVITLPRVLFP